MTAAAAAKQPAEITHIRTLFPSLSGDFVFFENAGGSQVPAVVADAVREHMLACPVQVGAPYPASERATETYAQAHAFANRFMNGERVGGVVLGASSSALFRMLSDAYADILQPGDEVVVMEANHESCIGPWLRLEKAGVKVRWWKPDPETQTSRLEELAGLLNEKTKLVAFSHVSNLLGEIAPAAQIAEMAHAAGARVVCDGVAFAPHHAIDVEAWGVDFYAYSGYKVFGPHVGVMFGRHEAWAELTGANHFFIPKEEFPRKFELGSASYEGAAGLQAVGEYLKQASNAAGSGPISRTEIEAAWRLFAQCEAPLTARFIEWLGSREDFRIVGRPSGGPERVSTISFLHDRLSPPELCAKAQAKDVGIRFGHMYSYRLCQALGIDTQNGVCRASFAHYNTLEEVERLIVALQ